jgi:hypothetical protein
VLYIQQLVYGMCSIPILQAVSQHKHMTCTNCCIYRTVPPDDEQLACSKHVGVISWTKSESKLCIVLVFIIQIDIAVFSRTLVRVYHNTC